MKKLFTLSLAVMLSMLFSSVASAKQLYVVGDGVFGGWNPGSPKAMTLAADGITNTMDVTLTSTAYWAVCDGADSNWTTFNNTYRYGYKANGNQNVEIGEYPLIPLNNGTLVLKQGEYHISINSETMLMTITGKKEDLVISVMSVVGPLVGGWPNGEDWSVAKDMTKVSDTQWTLTLTDIILAAGSYEWKVAANHKWGDFDLPTSGNNSIRINESGVYTLTFDVDTSGDGSAILNAVKTDDANIDYYYIMVGNDTAIFGTEWDPDNENNMMKLFDKDEDVYLKSYSYDIDESYANYHEYLVDIADLGEDIYLKTYNNVTLSAGTVLYQAVEKSSTGSISWTYPGQNKELEIAEDGVYNITFIMYYSMFDFDDPIVTKGEGQSTSIRNVEIKKSNAAIYNLNGQRVSNPAKGIYILNGRKYAVK